MNKERYGCSYCELTFTTKSNASRHEKYRCKVNKTFEKLGETEAASMSQQSCPIASNVTTPDLSAQPNGEGEGIGTPSDNNDLNNDLILSQNSNINDIVNKLVVILDNQQKQIENQQKQIDNFGKKFSELGDHIKKILDKSCTIGSINVQQNMTNILGGIPPITPLLFECLNGLNKRGGMGDSPRFIRNR